MQRRFFVTVIAPDSSTLQRLRAYDMDLFRQTAKVMDKREVVLSAPHGTSNLDVYQPTAKTNEAREFVIDGLLSLEEIARLVDDGYCVLVKESDVKKSRAQTEGIEFQNWLRGMEE